MLKNKFYKDSLKTLAFLAFLMIACRFTSGFAAMAVAVLGVGFALQRKPGWLSMAYVFFPFCVIVNRKIVGVSSFYLLSARLGTLVIIAAMMLSGAAFQGRVREKLPIGVLFLYCFVACLSSIDGWMPLISYLKLAQFALFLLGLLFVTHILQQSDKGLYQIRCMFMAMSILFLLGSLISYFIPAIGFSMQFSSPYEMGMSVETFVKETPQLLFNGLTYHSQMLAPTVALSATWVLCDMLFVEKRIGWLHAACLAGAPVMLFMSRSRGAILELGMVVLMVIFVAIPRARLKQALKSKFFQMMMFAVVAMVIAGAIGEAKNHAISRFLRKTEDVGGDTRTLKDAFTDSRKPSIEANMYDFRLNPALGKGFQVVPGMQQAYQAGMITLYSAPIEKGVTPYVILGETGAIGASVFAIFLMVFYGTCLKRRYLALMTLFTCFLTANLADSNIFSPGGGGGYMWIISCIGGFATDMMVKREQQKAQRPMCGFPPPMWPPQRSQMGFPPRRGW